MRGRRSHFGGSLLGALILAGATVVAQERPVEPDAGYIEQDGKRIPTRIAPPTKEAIARPKEQAAAATERVAGRQEVNEENLRDEPAAETALRERMMRKYYAEQRRWRVREYGVGGTARYRAPVSFGYSPAVLPQGAYYGMDPWGIQSAIDQAYALGREDEAYFSRRIEGEIETAARSKRVLAAHNRALDGSLDQLKRGQFSKAVASLTLAAKLDQGDPACRIHLAQARLALGQYDEAAKALRRALQLQPKLVFIDMQLDQYYPKATTIAGLADQLAQSVRSDGASAEVYFLQGFLEYQRDRNGDAYAAFVKASEGLGEDDLTRDFLGITMPANQARK